MFSTIFNDTSAEIKTKSADVLLKMTTILKEMRTAQLRSKNKRALESDVFQQCVLKDQALENSNSRRVHYLIKDRPKVNLILKSCSRNLITWRRKSLNKLTLARKYLRNFMG